MYWNRGNGFIGFGGRTPLFQSVVYYSGFSFSSWSQQQNHLVEFLTFSVSLLLRISPNSFSKLRYASSTATQCPPPLCPTLQSFSICSKVSLRLVVCPCPYICLLLCRCPISFTSPTPSHPVPKWSALWRSRQFRMPDQCMHAARLEWSFRPIAFPRRFASDRRLAWRRGKPLRDNFIIGVFQRWSSNEYYSNILPIHQPLILEAIRLRNIALHCSVHARSHAVSGGST